MMRKAAQWLLLLAFVASAAADVTGNITPPGGSGSGGTPSFSAVTSGSNTAATMTVGTGASLAPTGSGTIEATGLSALSGLPSQAANTIVMNATGSSASPTAVAVAAATQADLQASTTFTISPTGCTPSAHAGGPFGGTITLASGPCTSIVVTFNGSTGFTAPNGYHCSVSDRTALAAGTWIPAWGESASTTTTATIPIPGAAGSTDVISFSCDWY